MGRIEVTDEWLYQYMPVVDAAMVQELESKTDKSYEFSKRFKRRIKKLIRWERQSTTMREIAAVGRRAAVITLIILSSAMVVTMSVEAYRIQFFETIKTVFDDYFIMNYEMKDERGEFENYKYKYLPEGYKQVEEQSNENTCFLSFENGDGMTIFSSQSQIADGQSMLFDSEYDDEVTYEVDSGSVVIRKYKEGTKIAYYEYKDYVFLISVDKLEDNEIINMIKSLCVK